MSEKLMNPRMLEVGYKKDKLPFRMKTYRPVVGRIARGVFRTATEAQRRAVEVYARWCRLYDAAVAAMVEPTAETLPVSEQGPAVAEV